MKKLVLSLLLALVLINPVQAKQVCEDGKCLDVKCTTDNVCKIKLDENNQETFMYVDLTTGAFFTRGYELKNGVKLYEPGHGISTSEELKMFRAVSGMF